MLKATRRKIRTKARQTNPMAVAPARVKPTPTQMAAERPSREEWEAMREGGLIAVEQHEKDIRYQRIGWAIGSVVRFMFLIVWLPLYTAYQMLKFIATHLPDLMYAAIGIFGLFFVYMVLKVSWEAGLLW